MLRSQLTKVRQQKLLRDRGQSSGQNRRTEYQIVIQARPLFEICSVLHRLISRILLVYFVLNSRMKESRLKSDGILSRWFPSTSAWSSAQLQWFLQSDACCHLVNGNTFLLQPLRRTCALCSVHCAVMPVVAAFHLSAWNCKQYVQTLEVQLASDEQNLPRLRQRQIRIQGAFRPILRLHPRAPFGGKKMY